jgi:hypothetical protein
VGRKPRARRKSAHDERTAVAQDGRQAPVQTIADVERKIRRGDLTNEEVNELWDSVFLTLPEIDEFLKHVKEKPLHKCLYPIRCFQTARPSLIDQPVEKHHILGRGGKGRRDIMSSILNMAPLRWDIHAGPLRDSYDQRRVYLHIALTHVMNAIGCGSYVLNDIDRAFVQYIRVQKPEFADLYEHVEIPREP